jgi:hypothetical protein
MRENIRGTLKMFRAINDYILKKSELELWFSQILGHRLKRTKGIKKYLF